MIRTVKVAPTWIISVKVFQHGNTKAVSVGQGLTMITKVFMLKCKGSNLLKHKLPWQHC